MSETSQNYSPAQLLAIGQRAESEGKIEYATQFYMHLAEHYRHTAEGHEALYGLQRIEQYRQAQAAQAAQAAAAQQIPAQHAYGQAQHQQANPQLQRQAQPQTGGRPATRTAQAQRQEWQAAQQEQAVAANGVAHRSSLPARVSDEDEEDDDARLPRLMRGGAEQDYVPTYRIGRSLTVVMAAIGWTLLAIGLPLFLAGLAGVPKGLGAAGLGGLPIGVELGVAAMVFGIVLLFAAHLARAVFDSAAATRELVEIERAKAGW